MKYVSSMRFDIWPFLISLSHSQDKYISELKHDIEIFKFLNALCLRVLNINMHSSYKIAVVYSVEFWFSVMLRFESRLHQLGKKPKHDAFFFWQILKECLLLPVLLLQCYKNCYFVLTDLGKPNLNRPIFPSLRCFDAKFFFPMCIPMVQVFN